MSFCASLTVLAPARVAGSVAWACVSHVTRACRNRTGAEKVAEAVQEMMDAVDCPICMERPANTALSCGHCFCCQEGCESQTFTTCATCRRETAACRTPLYGPVTSLHDILSSKFQMEGLFPKREDARALVGNPAPPKRERGAGAVQNLPPPGQSAHQHL